jgi:hypothetical protein
MFEDGHAAWLVPFVRLASLEGLGEADRMNARFRRGAAEAETARPSAEVHLGDRSLRIDPPGFAVELGWRTEGYGDALRRFRGRVSAAPLARGETLLTLEGSFGSASHADMDRRIADRRAGEATLRSILRLLRVAVEEAQHHRAI